MGHRPMPRLHQSPQKLETVAAALSRRLAVTSLDSGQEKMLRTRARWCCQGVRGSPWAHGRNRFVVESVSLSGDRFFRRLQDNALGSVEGDIVDARECRDF